jgi:hypothetical protein
VRHTGATIFRPRAHFSFAYSALAASGRECRGRRLSKGPEKSLERLRKVKVEGVNLLSADIAGEERGFSGAQAGPRTRAELFGERTDTFEIKEAVEFGIADAKPKVSRTCTS